MTKKILIFLSITVLILSVIPTTNAFPYEDVHLPDSGQMWVVTGHEAYFDLTLFGIKAGFDISNGTYHGWCIQCDVTMTQNVNYPVNFYSSYDPNLPSKFTNENWKKVNYIINHRNGSMQSIQNAIWFFMCDRPCPENDTDAAAMIAEADGNFIPEAGERIAIIVDVDPGYDEENSEQRTFLEYTLPLYAGQVNGLVWNDKNKNGIQEKDEPGIPNINVYLSVNGSQTETQTGTDGRYLFGIFPEGEGYIKVNLPNGYQFSPIHQGSNSENDSDVDTTGRTANATLSHDVSNQSWDAGMHQNSPDNPGGGYSDVPENRPPTADGTAGAPYQGVVGQEIPFNGSRSYDSDGAIVKWAWSFGDGTIANATVVQHAYKIVGTYNVSLTVTDNDGAKDIYHTQAKIRNHSQPPLRPSFDGPKEGNRNTTYTFNVTTTDPNNVTVQYMITWGDGSQETTEFVSSSQRVQLTHQWRPLGFYIIQVCAVNEDNLTSDTLNVPMAIDVRYVGSYGYLINSDGVGPFDQFYDNETQTTTAVQLKENGEYIITVNGQATVFNAITGAISALQPPQKTIGSPPPMLIIGIIAIIILLVVIAVIASRFRHKTK